MRRALRWLRIAIPFIRIAADELAERDENETGIDDRAAVALNYAADILEALTQNRPVPSAPDELR